MNALVDECIDEKYLDTVERKGHDTDKAPRNLIRKTLSTARAKFRRAVSADTDKNHFPTSGKGYIFRAYYALPPLSRKSDVRYRSNKFLFVNLCI